MLPFFAALEQTPKSFPTLTPTPVPGNRGKKRDFSPKKCKRRRKKKRLKLLEFQAFYFGGEYGARTRDLLTASQTTNAMISTYPGMLPTISPT